jgi:hypothetical protein
VDDASLQFDHEQHVVTTEEHGIDMEEVGGHDAFGLGREELAPGRTRSSGSRRETVPAQDRSDARLRHADAELLQLADDAEVAPPGILPGQAQDQLDGLVGKGRTTFSTMGVGPAPANKRAVPAKDRLRCDEERTPALARYETSEEGNEGTVGPGEAGTCNLAAQHGQLVTEYEDLRLLGRGVHPMDTEQPEDATDQTVEEGQGHEGRASQRALWLVQPGWRVIGPFTC